MDDTGAEAGSGEGYQPKRNEVHQSIFDFGRQGKASWEIEVKFTGGGGEIHEMVLLEMETFLRTTRLHQNHAIKDFVVT